MIGVRTTGLLAAGLLVVSLGLAGASWLPLRDSAFRAAESQASGVLRLTVRALDGALGRFRVLTGLLAADAGLAAQVLSEAADAGLDARMASAASITGATAVHVLRADGSVAASAGAAPDAEALAPWVAQARIRGAAQGLRIVPDTGAREMTLAARIAGGQGAVVAVRFNLDELEAEWRRQPEAVLVAAQDGSILMSTQRDWRPGSVLASDTGVVRARGRQAGVTVLDIADPPGGRWVEARQAMPREDWTLRVWVDTAPYLAAARRSAGLIALSGALVALLAALVWQQRLRLAERIRLTEGARARLEQRVEARTAELAALNAQLATEIEVRRTTEADLRATQADLIQAGKLAALGQMSAALSHEINQPLAAVRNFADTAGRFLDRGDIAPARENLARILGLVDRISALARHLRDVARKPDRPLSDVALGPVVAEALVTVGPRLRAAGAEVTTDLPANLPRVRAGPLRLGQVLVNLLSNAADAVEGRADRRITLRATVEGAQVLVTVSDTGPGVPPAIAHRIFDPFFTTKTVGAGLGLGLSISYNIAKDFGGDLRLGTGPDGGAAFTLALTIAGKTA